MQKTVQTMLLFAVMLMCGGLCLCFAALCLAVVAVMSHAVMRCTVTALCSWAARSSTWLLIKLTTKGVAFPFLFFLLHYVVTYYTMLCFVVACCAVLL